MICIMCHVLLVPPRAINEVFVICAHAILGKDYVTTLDMELPHVDRKSVYIYIYIYIYII